MPPASTFITVDGYRVELVLVQRSLRHPPRPALRVTFRKYHIADVETAHEVSEYVDLASLEPVSW